MKQGCTDKAYQAYKLIIWILLIALVLFIVYPTDRDSRATEGSFAGKIPTVEEIQILVGVEPDGIPGPNTIKAWKLAENNQHAARYNYMFEEVKK